MKITGAHEEEEKLEPSNIAEGNIKGTVTLDNRLSKCSSKC